MKLPDRRRTIRRLALAFIACFSLAAIETASARAAGYDWMFEPEAVAQISLGLPEESREMLNEYPTEYAPATFAINGTGGQTFGPVPVELRLKGSASFRTLDGKSAFKLKFAKANRPWGLKKMTLNNMVQDPTRVHETLAYEIFRAMEVPAARSGYANVTVNGDSYGLYLNLETFDDQAMERWFGSTGHLYEADISADFTPQLAPLFEVDEGDEQDTSDLDALIEAAGTDLAGWLPAMENVADLEEMIRMWATEVFIGQWDGYVYHANNYYVHADEEGRFSMLPSGNDQAFRNNFEFFLEDQENHPRSLLFRKCLAVPGCRAEYAAALVEVRDKVRQMQIGERALHLYGILRPSIVADPRRESTVEESDDAIDGVGSFIALQDQIVDLLAAEVPKAPEDLAALAAPGAIDVSWKAARTRGAAPVNGYLIAYRKIGDEKFSKVEVDHPGSGAIRIAGLRGGAEYEVNIRARSTAGPGAVAEAQAPVTAGPLEIASPRFSSAPAGILASTSAEFRFDGEPGSNFECRLDAGDWESCQSPVVHSNLPQGPHSFSIRQSDQAGNSSPAISRNWSVDTVHPRLIEARYLSRKAGRHRIRVKTRLEVPALTVRLSSSRRKPSPRAPGKISRKLSGQQLSLRYPHRLRWVRIEDQAGNTSVWKRIRS